MIYITKLCKLSWRRHIFLILKERNYQYMEYKKHSVITPYVQSLAEKCIKESYIDPELYTRYEVKRGLRNFDGRGVLTGLTEISEIQSFHVEGDHREPVAGSLFYRGINVSDIVNGISGLGHFGFEESVYLLLFGKLPNSDEFSQFKASLADYRVLPTGFVRDVIQKAPSKDMMNSLARSVLTLYSYDENADDVSLPNVLRQCLQLIALFPLLSVYSYQAYAHYFNDKSLVIHTPEPKFSTAENILHLLRADSSFTDLEAKVLDVALILHAEHGGGNNSTFTNHVVTSSGTDTYSVIAASLGSLKGPKHGGANNKVIRMFDDLKDHVKSSSDKDGIRSYLEKILAKEAFDKSGLIYGMGHAIYSVSDPRAEIFKEYAKRLSVEKGIEEEFLLYENTAQIASEVIASKRKIYKGVSPNIDFYSGFVYRTLGLPPELFTPIFAIARIAGWSAHRMEELINAGKIIRPAYLCIKDRTSYTEMENR